MRGRVNLFIGAVVLSQMVIPLRYYVGGSPYDIRFAWRMLLENSLTTCITSFKVNDTVQPARPLFSDVWLGIGNRGVLAVPQEMTRRLCQQHPGQPVFVEMRCVRADGTKDTIQDGNVDVCKTSW